MPQSESQGDVMKAIAVFLHSSRTKRPKQQLTLMVDQAGYSWAIAAIPVVLAAKSLQETRIHMQYRSLGYNPVKRSTILSETRK